MKGLKLIIGLGGIALLLSGCGTKNDTTTAKSSESYPVTISNYTKAEGGTNWTKKNETFKSEPKKVLANTKPAAELLLHLGLKKNIVAVGADFGVGDPAVAQEYKQLKKLSDSYIGKELALSVNPDMIYGRGGLFDNQDWGTGTVDTLNEMNVPTYVLETSISRGTFNSVYKDIDNLGKIFNVQEKAVTFSKEIKARQTTVEKKLAKIKKNKSFAYLHMSDPNEILVYSANGESFFNDIFKMAKLDNIFKDVKGDVSIESLIEKDPEVLIVPDWSTYQNGVSGKKIIAAILKNPKLSGMKAIKSKQVYAVDYNYMFGYGYQALTGIEKLVDEMYPNSK